MVVLAVLIPAGFTGWLLTRPGDGGGGGDPAGATARPSESRPAERAPGAPRPSDVTPGPAAGGDQPLAGRVVVVDPGHNPGNRDHPREIARSVPIGTGSKECDTTGTATDSGYAEAEFTLDVARRIRTLLERDGATVRLTHDGDRPWGPCIDERAEIGNRAEADAVVSVHADGAPSGARGFHVILPGRVREGGADTTAITGPSRALGEHVADAYARETGNAPADYIGGGSGLDVRSDLGGLNLSTVPKVFVECGNMRNARDAGEFTDARGRARTAEGIADGIARYLSEAD
ncbi:N-acetylmuramoyl-L-alanine amidase [Streptomyces sp. PLAI1-29]|uniref:N-acetylmuramoyl-L-alanine amidase n=2 Tax=Streptomyces zingiberis TaxID=2053010 RepID=A0ABX1BTA1_9ACTN|nr:N-acetylmuramoyl-L-alanine amidase [Streptomyces zingiberis]NJP99635.1 N-acetylmuramoyl-L-alanine amidase [Streptomyces zingiberis]